MTVNVKLKFFIYRCHILIVVSLVLLAVLIPIVFRSWARDWRVLAPVLGGLFSFAYSVQKQALDESVLFRGLFREFNHRYDQLDDALNAIREGNETAELKPEEIGTLYHYFNLCGEEFLYYKKGYIYPEAWESWLNGMMIYYENARIKRLWAEELRSGSYYGLTLPPKTKISTLGLVRNLLLSLWQTLKAKLRF